MPSLCLFSVVRYQTNICISDVHFFISYNKATLVPDKSHLRAYNLRMNCSIAIVGNTKIFSLTSL